MTDNRRKHTDAEELLVRLARDLSTKTEEEVYGSWPARDLKALHKIAPGKFDFHIKQHNPIYYLALQAWFDNDPTLLYPELHRDRFCKELLEFYFEPYDEHEGLIVLAQRDAFKTTFVHGIFAQFLAIREKYVNKKDRHIALIHHKEPLAMQNLVLLKSKSISHKWFQEVWPEFSAEEDFGSSKAYNWPCKEKARTKERSLVATGLGARLTGEHYHWVLFDDIVTEDHTNSKIIRDEALFKYAASEFLLDTREGRRVCSGTFYHVNDLWNKLVKSDRYRVLHIQAGGRDTGKPLSFPTRHTQKFLDRKRESIKATTGTDLLYWLQYQLMPKADNLVAADPSWVKHCTLEEVTKKAANLGTVLTIDPAWKGSKNSGQGDSACLAMVGLERRGAIVFRYLLDMVHSNTMTALDGIEEVFRLCRKWGCSDVAPEEHGGRTFKTLVEAESDKRGIYLNVIDLKSQNRGKAERITTFLNHVQAGHFYICDTVVDPLPFMSQLEDFPQLDHDDAIDAVAYSCDPNVVELYQPNFGYQRGEVFEPLPEEPRTRYTTV